MGTLVYDTYHLLIRTTRSDNDTYTYIYIHRCLSCIITVLGICRINYVLADFSFIAPHVPGAAHELLIAWRILQKLQNDNNNNQLCFPLIKKSK